MKEWMQSDQSKQIRLGKETVQKREKENGKWDPAFICICIPMHTYLIFYSLYIFLFFDSLFALPKDKKQQQKKTPGFATLSIDCIGRKFASTRKKNFATNDGAIDQ